MGSPGFVLWNTRRISGEPPVFASGLLPVGGIGLAAIASLTQNLVRERLTDPWPGPLLLRCDWPTQPAPEAMPLPV